MNHLSFRPELTKFERKLIKRIAEMQLASLTSILTERTEDLDLESHCSEYGIQKLALKRELRASHLLFANTLENPAAIFDLNYHNRRITKALIYKFFFKHKGRKKLLRKFEILEKFDFCLN